MIQLDTTHENVFALAVSCVALFYGIFSKFLKENLYLSETFISTVLGLVVGLVVRKTPLSLDDHLFKDLSRFIVAVQVMCAAKYLHRNWKDLFVFLGPVMSISWLISGGLAYGILGIPFFEALVLSSCIVPTDPVLAHSILKGQYAEKHVPKRVRSILLAESGANDGLGYPFLFLAINLLQKDDLMNWINQVVLYQICLSVFLGVVIGYVFRKILLYSYSHQLIDSENFQLYGISLATFIFGLLGFLSTNDILACFVAGNALTNDDFFRKKSIEHGIHDVLDNVLNIMFFSLWAMLFPWDELKDVGPIALVVVFCLLVHIAKRVPVVLALYRFTDSIKTWREAVFAGWFGPTGVSAIFYACLIPEILPGNKFIAPVVNLIVLFSVIIHGLSVPIIIIHDKFIEFRNGKSSSRETQEPPEITQNETVVSIKHSLCIL